MNYKAQLKWWVTFIEDLTLVSRLNDNASQTSNKEMEKTSRGG